MYKIKKIVISLLIFAMFLPVKIIAEDYDFVGNEDHYREICSGDSEEFDREVCTAFITYINSQYAEKLQQIVDIEKDIQEAVKNAKNYAYEIALIQQDIEQLNEEIASLTSLIESKQNDIDKAQAEIDDLRFKVIRRMEEMEPTMHFNTFIEFLMGSRSFTELILRFNGLKTVMDYDSMTTARLEQMIEKLSIDKLELEDSKLELDEKKIVINNKRDELISKKLYYENLKEKYQAIEADLIAQGNQYAADIKTLKNNINLNYLNGVISSKGWRSPIDPSLYWKSAGTWKYDQGSPHFGMDFAASIGTSVYAPGNGIVVHSYTGCDDYGYLGNSCGNNGSTYGGGNQLRLVVVIDGNLYGLVLCHLKRGTLVSTGTVVVAGDKIAEVASSGNSTGPHMHMEVIYLGDEKDWESNGDSALAKYVANWDGNLSFGAGWKNYDTICSNNDSKAPCRVRPEYVLLGGSY